MEVTKAKAQYAKQEAEYLKAIEDLNQEYVQHTAAITKEFQAQQANLEEQQNALDVTDAYKHAVCEILQMAQVHSEPEQLLDNNAYADLYDAFNVAVAERQQDIYLAYEVESLSLEQEYTQKILEVTNAYEFAIAQLKEVCGTGKGKD